MIHVFAAKNFYSFEDKVTIDFRVDENVKESGSYVTTATNTRISLVEAILGPNASGKTTALRALAFLQWFLLRSLRQDESSLPFVPFAGNKDTPLPTELSVEFEMDKGVHIYTLVIDASKVISETLQIRSLTKQRMTVKKLFARTWDGEKEKYTIDDLSFGLPEEYWTSSSLKNTSIIPAASRFGHEYAQQITNYWQNLETNIEVDDRFIPSRFGAYRALRYYEGHEDSRKKAEEDVRRYADFGIEGFGADGAIKHKFGDKTFELDFEHESSGTHHYISLRRMMDTVFEKGGILVMDEFDMFLHPFMFESLVKKFLDPKVNKGHAQLLLTAQDLLILNKLDKYQINFAEKSDRGATSIRRLDSIKKGIRPDENFLAKYMKNVYGAWPEEKPEAK